MSTQNRRVAAYISSELDDRFRLWMEQKGIKSESKAIIHALEAVLGKDEKPPAIDRLQKLEARVEIIEELLCGQCFELTNEQVEKFKAIAAKGGVA